MIASSSQIVKEVNNTTHLGEALALVVKRSRSSTGADACSVYIYDAQSDQFVLMAVDGVIPGEIGKAQVSLNDGLVGWVAAHEEVINLSNTADHPGFDHASKTWDASFHGFMDAPIIHHGLAMGNIGRQVLVHLQQAAPASRTYPSPCILAGEEVSPAEISNVPRDRLAGIVSVHGSALSHTAIICRALNIPAVMGLTDLVIGNLANCEITLDGSQGTVCINPSPVDIDAFEQRLQEERAIAAQLETLLHVPHDQQDTRN